MTLCRFSAVLFFCAAGLISGCAQYVTPGRGVELSAAGIGQGDPNIDASLKKKPLAQFPTAIAVARIESAGYSSYTNQGWGQGRFALVSERDIEDPKVLDQWHTMPQVLGIAPVTRLLVPNVLNSDRDLHGAAAQLHADLLMIYTVDTTFKQTDLSAPLTLITLGLAPDQRIRLTSTVSGILLDTRNGYVYSVFEGTEHRDGLTIGWNNESAVDDVRRDTEASAFKKMAAQFADAWPNIVKQYQPGVATAGQTR